MNETTIHDDETTATGQALQTRCGDPRIHTYGVILEAMARLGRIFEASLREHVDISQTWFEALLRIARNGGWMTMGDLAGQVALTSGGVTRLVDRLVEEGYAERRACPTDRRVQHVAITGAGRQVLAEAIEIHLADLDTHFMSRMSHEEREVVVRVMERLRSEPDTVD